jgi:membrane protease YdiL (CAAX protease family)
MKAGTQFFFFLAVWFILLRDVLFLLRGRIPAQVASSPAFMIALQLAVFILPLCIWVAIRKETLSENIPNIQLGRANFVLITGISILLLPVMATVSALSSLLADNAAVRIMSAGANQSLWVMLVTMAVTPAIVEEVAFRGYIQTKHAQSTRPFWVIAVLNGFIFGVIHLDIQQFFYAFLMGIIFAYMVHITRSIRSAIYSHFLVNGINVLMFYVIMQMDMEVDYTIETSPVEAAASVGLVALVLMPFLIILWRAFVRHNASRTAAFDIKQALADESTTPASEAPPDSL